MLKLKPSSAKIRRIIRRVPKKKVYLYLSLLTAAIAIVWWILAFYYFPNHPSAQSQYYDSLDLSLARQASYTNGPIKVIKDFGTANGVHKELVNFDVPKDGLSEYGLMTLPAGQAKNYPVLILCHGYSSPQAYSTLESYIGDMNFYSQHGFAVIKPDYRGNGFSLSYGLPTGAYYSMAYNTDVMSLIAAIKSTNYLNKDNISLWGHSMGAYIALRAAVLSADIKNLILLSGPVGTPQDMYADYQPISDNNNPLALEVRDQELQAHGTPLSNPEYWNKVTPLSYLKDIKAHVQIHVGTADKVVPPKFSADLDRILNRDHIAHQYFIYKGGHHGLGQQRGLIWSRSLTLLNGS